MIEFGNFFYFIYKILFLCTKTFLLTCEIKAKFKPDNIIEKISHIYKIKIKARE